MQDPIKILFDHAMEVRIPAYLEGSEYKGHAQVLRRQEEHFLSLLSPAESRKLEEYFSEVSCMGAMDMEAAFRAGIAVALDLVRG